MEDLLQVKLQGGRRATSSCSGKIPGGLVLGFFLNFFSGHPDCQNFSGLGILPELLLWVSSPRHVSFGVTAFWS